MVSALRNALRPTKMPRILTFHRPDCKYAECEHEEICIQANKCLADPFPELHNPDMDA